MLLYIYIAIVYPNISSKFNELINIKNVIDNNIFNIIFFLFNTNPNIHIELDSYELESYKIIRGLPFRYKSNIYIYIYISYIPSLICDQASIVSLTTFWQWRATGLPLDISTI